jgi:UDP-N-acetylmuramate--alanine ligase
MAEEINAVEGQKQDVKLSDIKKAYFIGLKGSGMIGLAQILNDLGVEIAGSDVSEEFFSDAIIKSRGFVCYEGFSTENIEKEWPADVVVYSSAYTPERNEELKYAFEKRAVCLSYAEMVGLLSKDKFTIAVCGTHGKTTTSAMLALAMKYSGADPTALIGSKVHQIGSGALSGSSKFFVVEADEYQHKFFLYAPIGAILTNVDFDHPDFFQDFDHYKQAFIDFVRRIPPHGFLVVWAGSVDTLAIAREARCKIIFYEYFDQGSSSLELAKQELGGLFRSYGKNNLEFVTVPEELKLQVPGRHNCLNATAAYAACMQLGLDKQQVFEALNNYQGAARRFEYVGRYKGAMIIDDYAHHPEEIKATLKAARERYEKERIICVFHPHTYSRTKALLEEFSQSFDDCSEVIVLDIYGSAREAGGDVHSQELVAMINRYKQQAVYAADLDEAFEILKEKLTEGDVLITMGAGNVNELAQRLAKAQQD